MSVKRTKKCPAILRKSGCSKAVRQRSSARQKGDKSLHLFDTFEGLPKVEDIDMVWPFYEGKFAASYDSVKDYLKDYNNVFFL